MRDIPRSPTSDAAPRSRGLASNPQLLPLAEKMQNAQRQLRHLLREYDHLISGLKAEQVALDPGPGLKTAGWYVGHLVITGDFARRLCGWSPLAPKEWRAIFAPDTTPSVRPEDYPDLLEMVRVFRTVHEDLAARLDQADLATLALPNPFERARGAFPTSGDFVRYIVSGHLGYHLGQLSGWHAMAAARR